MPRRSLLSTEQRTRLFAIPVGHAEMAKHYVLSADDLALVRTKRRSINQLGFAIQARSNGTPRFHPTFPRFPGC
jgi:TnpA family transposase